MWNAPTQKDLEVIPELYSSDELPFAEKICYMHFFIGGCDWYVAEFDGVDTFFGYINLNDDDNAEWDYFSLSELKSIKIKGIFEIDRDLFWSPKAFSEIDNVKTYDDEA